MTLPETVRNSKLPWSAKMAYKTLELSDGGMTQKELRESVGMAPSTAHDALETLESKGLVEARNSTTDHRQQVYFTN